MAKHKLARRASSAPAARKPSRLRRIGRVAGKRMKKHAVKHAGARAGALVGIGACAALGYAERMGKVPSMGGFEPSLVLGLVLGFGVPMLAKGKLAAHAAEAGAALSGVAAYKLAAGAPMRVGYSDQVGEDDDVSGDDDDVSGDDDD
jgi:hypothetical protein